MTPEEQLAIENFGISLVEQSKSHEDWLKIMRFGLATFAENQALLLELIFAEALRELKSGGLDWTSSELATHSQEICRELGLRLAPVQTFDK